MHNQSHLTRLPFNEGDGTTRFTVVQTCGLMAPPEDPAALAANAALRTRLGTAGLAYATAHLGRQAGWDDWFADATGMALGLLAVRRVLR